MRLARNVTVAEDSQATKEFSAAEFRSVMNSSSFVGATTFWRQLTCLCQPNAETTLHAKGILRAWAEAQFRACGGEAFSPQHSESLEYCGLQPTAAVRPQGALAKETTRK